MLDVVSFINPRLSSKNVGDIFIDDSVKRILKYDRENSVEIDPRKPITLEHIEAINRTKAAIIVGTCLWYRSLPKPSRWHFNMDLLRQIKVPIIPMGVGTQRHFDADNAFDPGTLEQIKHIHSSCEVASARDIRTIEVLHESGIRNVALTGCPTLFRSLKKEWKLCRSESNHITVTVRKGQRHNVKTLLKLLEKKGCRVTIAAQGAGDCFLNYSIPFFQKKTQTLYEYALDPYLKLVDECAGAIGWRLHGNMIYLAAGKPAMLLSNSSRGQSFCDTFRLPTLRSPDYETLPVAQIAEIIERFFDDSTFAALPGKYAEMRGQMVHFLDRNGLQHNL